MNPQLMDGVSAMFVGMSVVFSFLIILVFAISITTNVVNWLNKVFPPKEPQPKAVKKQTTDESEIALAIALAKKGI